MLGREIVCSGLGVYIKKKVNKKVTTLTTKKKEVGQENTHSFKKKKELAQESAHSTKNSFKKKQ